MPNLADKINGVMSRIRSKPIELPTAEFWQDLKKCIAAKSGNSIGVCREWTDRALRLLGQNGYGRNFYPAMGLDIGIRGIGTLSEHHWIEALKDGRIFIADGTIGQIFSDYLDGFYGFLEEAPRKLQEIYLRE